MDSVHTCVHYFEVFVEFLWSVNETFTDIFGVFGYIVAIPEFYTIVGILLNFWDQLEVKIFGINFLSMQLWIFESILGKNGIENGT